MIDKKSFVEAINEVQDVCSYQNKLNNFFSNNEVDGYIFQPDCTATVVNLLHNIFGEKDKDEWISYFCFDLNFGKDWQEGMFTREDGTDIVLQTASDLYDLLLEEPFKRV